MIYRRGVFCNHLYLNPDFIQQLEFQQQHRQELQQESLLPEQQLLLQP